MMSVRTALPARRLAAATAIGLVLLLTFALVLFSPLLVGTVFGGSTAWIDLANIGQAYGGAAAVLSAFALMGVATSLLLQRRQARLQQIFAVRERHFELIKLGIERPELQGLFMSDASDRRPDPRVLYLNLFMSHLATLWDLRQMPEATLRRNVADLFGTSVSRAWWRQRGPTWSDRLTRHRLRFHEIVDQECAALESAAANGSSEEPDAGAPLTDHPDI